MVPLENIKKPRGLLPLWNHWNLGTFSPVDFYARTRTCANIRAPWRLTREMVPRLQWFQVGAGRYSGASPPAGAKTALPPPRTEYLYKCPHNPPTDAPQPWASVNVTDDVRVLGCDGFRKLLSSNVFRRVEAVEPAGQPRSIRPPLADKPGYEMPISTQSL